MITQNFVSLRNVVDNTMKIRHSAGLGVRHSAEIISESNEDLLYSRGILGWDTPQQLINNVIYVTGMRFALRGGVEHNNLKRFGFKSQIAFKNDSRDIKCLVYTEDPKKKTNQGGLICKGKPKVVWVYPTDGSVKDAVAVVKKYVGLMPQGTQCRKFHLRPRKTPTPSVWFCDQPYGINKVKNTVKEVCRQAGIIGKFTNHSLRATCATRMYNSNVPEQIIKETTGHRSECVRTYKRTNEAMKQATSNTVNNGVTNVSELVKDPMNDVFVALKEEIKPPVKISAEPSKPCADVDKKSGKSYELSFSKMLANVVKTRMELRKKMYPKSRLSLKKNKGHKVTIDLNVNVKK